MLKLCEIGLLVVAQAIVGEQPIAAVQLQRKDAAVALAGPSPLHNATGRGPKTGLRGALGARVPGDAANC
eukprot:11173815-Lingulodinium_polyedra.AAC.1